MPADEAMPSTIRRSDAHARRLWSTVHDAAVDEYGEGERAHRTAMAALKHEYEKVGDHWERKAENGPSDPPAGSGRRADHPTAEGVDATSSKEHLAGIARRLEIPGRSTMRKDELVAAIEKANRRATARSAEAERS